MARFYRIQIGSIRLTSDGTNGGTPCKLSIENAEDLMVSVSGNSVVAASGSRIRQAIDWTSGKEFSVKVNQMMSGVYENLKTLLNAANETNSSLTVSGVGDTGNFTVTAKPTLQKPFAASGFVNGRIKDVVLRFET